MASRSRKSAEPDKSVWQQVKDTLGLNPVKPRGSATSTEKAIKEGAKGYVKRGK